MNVLSSYQIRGYEFSMDEAGFESVKPMIVIDIEVNCQMHY
jgi:hypothetical protein